MKSIVTSIHRFTGCVAAAVLAASLVDSAWAQGTPKGPPAGTGAPANPNPRAESQARQLAEGRLRSAEMDTVAVSENQKHIQAVIVHMKEDFTRIQVLRNDVARNLIARKPLNYNLISEQTGEINKRASRLNVYMLAHSPENKEQNDPADLQSEEMIGALVELCKLVDSFTENPALKNAATVDVKEVEKAGENKARADKDLLAIIRLSKNIKKKSDSLKAVE
jgi:hypothetical protein